MAHKLADVATEMALDAFENDIHVWHKPDGTRVSQTDVDIERQLIELLVQQRPDDTILGEELGSRGDSKRRWILDPIDGTEHFLAGRTDWGTHVALEQGGEVVVGVITRPALRSRWWATRGGGAYCGPHDGSDDCVPLHVSDTAELATSRISIWTSEASARWDLLAIHAVRVASDLDDILRLAAGELECVFDVTGKPWDHAPAVILVEEAGGRVRDRLGGHRIDLGEMRYTNGRIDDQIDALLAS
jgi:histidinol-phosphatase